jgi:hypothetical protein
LEITLEAIVRKITCTFKSLLVRLRTI